MLQIAMLFFPLHLSENISGFDSIYIKLTLLNEINEQYIIASGKKA